MIDHRESVPVDAYEVPEPMREQVALAQPYEIAPVRSGHCPVFGHGPHQVTNRGSRRVPG